MGITYLNTDNVQAPKGSPVAVALVQDANGDVDGNSDKYVLPLTANTNWSNEVSTDTVEQEDKVIYEFDGTKTRNIEMTFIQSGIQDLNIVKELDGKKLSILKELRKGTDPSGGYGYLLLGTCEISGSFSKDFKSAELPVTFRIRTNTADKGIDTTHFDDDNFQADLAANGGLVTIDQDAAYSLITVS